jgi:hypothetical protein
VHSRYSKSLLHTTQCTGYAHCHALLFILLDDGKFQRKAMAHGWNNSYCMSASKILLRAPKPPMRDEAASCNFTFFIIGICSNFEFFNWSKFIIFVNIFILNIYLGSSVFLKCYIIYFPNLVVCFTYFNKFWSPILPGRFLSAF